MSRPHVQRYTVNYVRLYVHSQIEKHVETNGGSCHRENIQV